MTRRANRFWALLLTAVMFLAGCHPAQPFFLHEDGDLSHYVDIATDIEHADVEHPHLDEAEYAHHPLTVSHPDFKDFWDLSVEEVVSISLQNSKTIRTLGQVRQVRQVGSPALAPPEVLTLNPDFHPTVYDPAIAESGPNGVETALANFDAQFSTSVFWEKTDRAQNFQNIDQLFSPRLERDVGTFQAEVSKLAATGTQWSFRNVTTHERSNQGRTSLPFTRPLSTDWTTAFEVEARHPLLRGGGTQVNRIPIVLARIRTDVTLADFEIAVRNHVSDVERTYWDLYFFYRNLEAAKRGRDAALRTWQAINARVAERIPGGSAAEEAQAREQYFFFRSRVEEALRDLYKTENRLRYIMGLAPADGRLIRPSDEPTVAKVAFDWNVILCESLMRSVEIRRQRWRIKQRELELIAARNNLLPQLDVVGLYRWLGVGDNLISGDRNGQNFPAPGSTALDELTEGNYQESRVGLEFSLPIGLRRELAAVRHQQLRLAREKAVIEDIELEIAHELTDAVQNLEAEYVLTQTNFNRLSSARQQFFSVESAFVAGRVPLELLLDAQRRAVEVQIEYYQSLVEYNRAILQVHFRKGSLLEYDGIMLAEGPWPAKAYFDAEALARRRDASYYFDYGYSRPRVISRGPVSQGPAPSAFPEEAEVEAQGIDRDIPSEEVAAPEPTPADEPPVEELLPPGLLLEPARRGGLR